jgi:hypothetical protein
VLGVRPWRYLSDSINARGFTTFVSLEVENPQAPGGGGNVSFVGQSSTMNTGAMPWPDETHSGLFRNLFFFKLDMAHGTMQGKTKMCK